MFCYQCEQAANGSGCTKVGVCGKDDKVSSMQDLLIYVLKGLSTVALKARSVNVVDSEVDKFVCEGLFATVTNVDFNAEKIAELVRRAVKLRERIKAEALARGFACNGNCPQAAHLEPADDLDGLIMQGQAHGILNKIENEDIQSLKNTLLYGIKGIAAYADHAAILGQEDIAIYTFLHKALAAMLEKDITMDSLVDLLMECGQINLRTMELLDLAHTFHYGHPAPTSVPLGVKQGKAILISGHDLRDLELLLKQTEGKGIYIYTHGEMLPAHGYPELKKYPHFYGHYGTAWQNQHKEFSDFPGAILMTTNCIQKPQDSYKDNIQDLREKHFSFLIF
ncbi:MAG: hydroxylamine reductase [Gammaproteobacteria bacterium]|nr:hydroxylamine reductase [Gammaproteobacteria bacterium]